MNGTEFRSEKGVRMKLAVGQRAKLRSDERAFQVLYRAEATGEVDSFVFVCKLRWSGDIWRRAYFECSNTPDLIELKEVTNEINT